jgi:parallel beta-helix repeat protein
MRRALALYAFLIAIFTMGFATAAAAVDRLVDDNLVPCVSGGLPIHATINDAVAAAAPGEVIVVCAGTYSEFVEVFTDDLVIQAMGLVKLVSPGGPGVGFFVEANGVTIRGFDISGYTEADDCGIVASGIGGDILNNRVHDNDFGICVGFAEGMRIRSNVVENNASDAILPFLVEGLQVSSNTVRNNGGFGIWLLFCDFAGPVQTNVHQNSVTGNGGDGIFADACPAIIQNNQVRNNALLGPDFHGIHIFDSEGAVVTKNIVQSSNVGIFVEEVFDCTVSLNSVSFNAVGIDVFESDGCTFTRNNVSRSDVIDCVWDEVGTHTFTANACVTEFPAGAWD